MATKKHFERDIATLKDSIATAMRDVQKGIRTRDEVAKEIKLLRKLLLEQLAELEAWLASSLR